MVEEVLMYVVRMFFVGFFALQTGLYLICKDRNEEIFTFTKVYEGIVKYALISVVVVLVITFLIASWCKFVA